MHSVNVGSATAPATPVAAAPPPTTANLSKQGCSFIFPYSGAASAPGRRRCCFCRDAILQRQQQQPATPLPACPARSDCAAACRWTSCAAPIGCSVRQSLRRRRRQPSRLADAAAAARSDAQKCPSSPTAGGRQTGAQIRRRRRRRSRREEKRSSSCKLAQRPNAADPRVASSARTFRPPNPQPQPSPAGPTQPTATSAAAIGPAAEAPHSSAPAAATRHSPPPPPKCRALPDACCGLACSFSASAKREMSQSRRRCRRTDWHFRHTNSARRPAGRGSQLRQDEAARSDGSVSAPAAPAGLRHSRSHSRRRRRRLAEAARQRTNELDSPSRTVRAEAHVVRLLLPPTDRRTSAAGGERTSCARLTSAVAAAAAADSHNRLERIICWPVWR